MNEALMRSAIRAFGETIENVDKFTESPKYSDIVQQSLLLGAIAAEVGEYVAYIIANAENNFRLTMKFADRVNSMSYVMATEASELRMMIKEHLEPEKSEDEVWKLSEES